MAMKALSRWSEKSEVIKGCGTKESWIRVAVGFFNSFFHFTAVRPIFFRAFDTSIFDPGTVFKDPTFIPQLQYCMPVHRCQCLPS